MKSGTLEIVTFVESESSGDITQKTHSALNQPTNQTLLLQEEQCFQIQFVHHPQQVHLQLMYRQKARTLLHDGVKERNPTHSRKPPFSHPPRGQMKNQ